MLTLRPYQHAALEKMLWSIKLPGNDICVLPTGAGKSVVIAKLAQELNQPILILQPSKEILEQNYKKLLHYVDESEVGIYSASVNRKEVKKYTFATIQSVYKIPDQFKDFKVVLIDECHTLNPKNLDGMFTQFLEQIGSPKVFGFTATPYRLETTYQMVDGYLNAGTGLKLINRMKPFFWSRIIYNISNQELIDQGYIVPLTYLDYSLFSHSELPFNKSCSDFDLEAISDKFTFKQDVVLDIIFDVQYRFKSVLVFCSSISQAQNLSRLTPNSVVVTGATSTKDREFLIENFKQGQIQTVFNVGVLTTGFDFPGLESIILLRPTQSLALYLQMLGRGVRLAPGKETCHVIDLSGTVKKLGKIETVKLDKVDAGKWDIVTETGQWHNKILYTRQIEPKYSKQQIFEVEPA